MLAKFGEGDNGSNAVSFPLFCVRAVAAVGWLNRQAHKENYDTFNRGFMQFRQSNMAGSGRKKTCCGRLPLHPQVSLICFTRFCAFEINDENGNAALTVKSLLSRVNPRFPHLCKIPYLRGTCAVNVGKCDAFHCLPSPSSSSSLVTRWQAPVPTADQIFSHFCYFYWHICHYNGIPGFLCTSEHALA